MAEPEPSAPSDREGAEQSGDATDPPVPIDHRAQRVGLGMLASLAVGYGPLRDAVTGVGSFEEAIGRYLLCLGGSVAAALILGHLLDGPENDLESDERPSRTTSPR
jgi:hypothetical protein